MRLFDQGQGRSTAISLRAMSLLAVACFVAGATLPPQVFHLVISASHAAMPMADRDEPAFMKENNAAMSKMMADMSVAPSGDVNRDFVDMMIPHHQGAIDMAKALLAHGDSEALRRIAQEIVITQQQEIVAMRLAIGEPAQSTASGGTKPHTTGSAPHDTGGMQMSPNLMSPNLMKMK